MLEMVASVEPGYGVGRSSLIWSHHLREVESSLPGPPVAQQIVQGVEPFSNQNIQHPVIGTSNCIRRATDSCYFFLLPAHSKSLQEESEALNVVGRLHRSECLKQPFYERLGFPMGSSENRPPPH